jgi:hypothetical protein
MLRTEEAAGTKQSASLVGPEKFLSSSSVKQNPSPAIERLEMRAIATVSCAIACACHLLYRSSAIASQRTGRLQQIAQLATWRLLIKQNVRLSHRHMVPKSAKSAPIFLRFRAWTCVTTDGPQAFYSCGLDWLLE